VAKIVKAIKEFSHPGSAEKKGVDLNKAIETTITVARNEWKYVADLEAQLDPELGLVPCLSSELNQVVLNLIVNAAHAIADRLGENSGGKGKITIITRRNTPWAEIDIQDSGQGIPPEIRSRIFEPFFTTKEVGKGTGQGLALAHSVVVNRHQGQIWFDSETGVGTTFHIRIPLEVAEAVRAGAEK
jgi:signal transduction histidine kinase